MLSGSRSTLGLLGGAGFFGTVLTLVLPGAVGSAPWIAVLLSVGSQGFNANVWESAEPYKTPLLSVLLIGSALLFGMLFHEVGTYIEAGWFDEHPQVGTKDEHLAEWRTFLRTAYQRVPVGHRYLRTMVQKMFFELAVAGAFVSLGLGIVACRCVDLILCDWWFTLASSFAAFTVACFAIHAAQDSHGILADVRHVLIRGTRSGDVKARPWAHDERPRNRRGPIRRFGTGCLLGLTTIFALIHLHDGARSRWLFAAGLLLLTAWRFLRARLSDAERVGPPGG